MIAPLQRPGLEVALDWEHYAAATIGASMRWPRLHRVRHHAFRSIQIAIQKLRESGVSVLLVEQNAQAALKIADRAYVMELGEFVLSGRAAEIAANDRVAASYLGFQVEGVATI